MLAEGEYNPSQGTSSKNDEKDQNHYVPPAKRWSQLSFRRFAKMSGINRLPKLCRLVLHIEIMNVVIEVYRVTHKVRKTSP